MFLKRIILFSLLIIIPLSVISLPHASISKNNTQSKNKHIKYGAAALGGATVLGIGIWLLVHYIKRPKIYYEGTEICIYDNDPYILKAVTQHDEDYITKAHDLAACSRDGHNALEVAAEGGSLRMVNAVRNRAGVLGVTFPVASQCNAINLAVENGWYDVVRALLPEDQASILFKSSEEQDKEFCFELMWNASNNTELLSYLTEHGANFNIRDKDNRTLLIKACQDIYANNNANKVHNLLMFRADTNLKDKDEKTAHDYLKQAPRSSDPFTQMDIDALKERTEPKQVQPLIQQSAQARSSINDKMMDDKRESDLFEAIAAGDVASAEHCITKDNINHRNSSGYSVMACAIQSSSLEMVRMVKAAYEKYDIQRNAIVEWISSTDQDSTEIFDELSLKFAADVPLSIRQNISYEILWRASHSEHMLKHVLSKGASLNSPNAGGMTLLIQACTEGAWTKAQVLIEAGIDLKLTYEQKTAEQWLIAIMNNEYQLPDSKLYDSQAIQDLLNKIGSTVRSNMEGSFIVVPVATGTLKHDMCMSYVLMLELSQGPNRAIYNRTRQDLAKQDKAFLEAFDKVVEGSEYQKNIPISPLEHAKFLKGLVDKQVALNSRS